MMEFATMSSSREEAKRDYEKDLADNTRRLAIACSNTLNYMLDGALANGYGKMDRFEYETLSAMNIELSKLRYAL